MAITVVSYTAQERDKWDAFVKMADNANFIFERNFMDYHSNRFSDCSAMVYDDNNLIGIFPANLRGDTAYSHQGLTYGGLIMAERKNVRRMIGCFYALINHYKEMGVKHIVYKPIPAYLCKTVNELEHFVLNTLTATTTKVDTTFIIDNRLELKLQERRRRSIKKGEKIATDVRIDNDFSAYWEKVLVPNLRDKFDTAPVHSLAEIELLHSRFPEQVKQANAYVNNEIAAGVTLFEFPCCVHCQYISSTDFGRDSGAIDLLFSNLINLFRPLKTYFSLGTANNSGNDINIGLCDWKEGWGSALHAHFHYKFDTENANALERFL